MKKFLFLAPAILMASCSLLGSKPDAPKVPSPKTREAFTACPDHPSCGEGQGGGYCDPSNSHHSDAAHCPLIK